MSAYYITHDPMELIAGTSNRTSPAYMEATKITRGDDLQRSIRYLRGFTDSIDRITSRKGTRDEMIVRTQGNIETLPRYKTMTEALGYLEKHLPSHQEIKAVRGVLDSLIKYRSAYRDAYRVREMLIVLEYEAAASIVIRSLSMIITTSIDIQTDDNGKIVIERANRPSGGVISKIIIDLDAELAKPTHARYLVELLKVRDREPGSSEQPDDIQTEAAGDAVAETISAISTVFGYLKKGIGVGYRLGKLIVVSAFGIVPLIQSVIYFFYKRKADTSTALETQANFVELNLEQLRANKSMDPAKKAEIIKRQKAYVATYRKKAERLRAQLTGEEREVSSEKKSTEPVTPADDDDFSID